MGIGILEILGGLTALCFAGYHYFTSTFNFWQSRGVTGPQPIPLYGNFKDIMFGKISIPDFVRREYEKYRDEPMFGVFASRAPILIINDAELIKEVLIKHFSSFANRGIRIFEKIEPLSANLVNLEAARWRPLRAKQTTMFTTVKLREMFYLMRQCADHLDKTLDEMVKSNDVVECCELTSRFSTDVIGACVFGIDMKALDDENSDFRRVGRKFIYADKWRAFKIRLKTICPWLFILLGHFMYDHEINDFFISSMIQTMEDRKKNNIKRGDFVDLLVDLRDHPEKLDIELTDSLLTAQAFAFFFAGFETSSTTMSNALYELALNPTIQNKLREEINDEITKNDGILEYSAIENMKYLQQVVSETLRKYPIVSILVRQAMENYTFTSRELSIPKDTRVWIPVYGIHRNPKIYPNPDLFDPERFNEENVKERHPSYYLPFGAGPRNCIGARFGSMQTKTGLVTILRSYNIEVCDKTPIPYVTHRRRFLLGPAAGIHLKFTKLD